ncbi:U32 family peptidase, partial [Candidatus Woesearchaeota archaeon]|nr:U32 family peptidase [Candidatus Woesearchaeota archaeon]
YYQKIGVAEILLESDKLKKGSTVIIIGNSTGVLRQKITSLQSEHKNANIINKGQRAAIKVNSRVRKNDKVFLIEGSKENTESKAGKKAHS